MADNIKGSKKCERCGCWVWLTPKGKMWKHSPTDGGKVKKGETACGAAEPRERVFHGEAPSAPVFVTSFDALARLCHRPTSCICAARNLDIACICGGKRAA